MPNFFLFYLFLGAQVLARLRFTGTVRGNIFGLGMVLIGFTFCAYLALLLSGISYMPLGHVGRKQKYYSDEIPVASGSNKSSNSIVVPASDQDKNDKNA